MLMIWNIKIFSDIVEEEELFFSFLLKNFVMFVVENGYVNEFCFFLSDIIKKLFFVNDVCLNKIDKKIIFVNENWVKENGGFKMGNGKVKNMY